MREAPVGILGAFVAERPYLSSSLLAPGLTALAVVGARQAGAGEAIAFLTIMALTVLVAPMALAAFAPRGAIALAGYAGLAAILAGILVAFDAGIIELPAGATAPPRAVTLAAFGYFVFLLVIAPLVRNVIRLGVLASFGAALGVAGASGYLALEGVLRTPGGAVVIALALTIGVGTGINVAADFSNFFTEGANRRRAAAAAGHSAVAPSAFSLMALMVFLFIYADMTGEGAINWRLIWAGFTTAAAAIGTALVAVVGGLVLSDINERAAVDENRRRRWFAARWRPLRLALPATTATAVIAIAGIVFVIAAFEVGVTAPGRFVIFILLLCVAAMLSFVSVRTSVLIGLSLTLSALLADYAIAILGIIAPAPEGRFAVLTLAAVALGALTASWRDAGERWRNARDTVENALSDGLRRYLVIVGAGAASLFVAMHVLAWRGAQAAMIYFLMVSLIALIIIPPAMTAMSARLRG